MMVLIRTLAVRTLIDVEQNVCAASRQRKLWTSLNNILFGPLRGDVDLLHERVLVTPGQAADLVLACDVLVVVSSIQHKVNRRPNMEEALHITEPVKHI